MYDEDEAIEGIKKLPVSSRLHISHITRNGLQNILSSYCLGGDVQRAINEVSNELEALGL